MVRRLAGGRKSCVRAPPADDGDKQRCAANALLFLTGAAGRRPPGK